MNVCMGEEWMDVYCKYSLLFNSRNGCGIVDWIGSNIINCLPFICFLSETIRVGNNSFLNNLINSKANH